MKKALFILSLIIVSTFIYSAELNDLSNYRNDFIKNIYKYNAKEKKFIKNGKQSQPLLKALGGLDGYCEARLKEDLPNTIIKRMKKDYYGQKLNILSHKQDVIIAEDIAIFVKKPKHWENPTVYISEKHLNMKFQNVASYMIRAFAEYYYHVTYGEQVSGELLDIKAKIFSHMVQAQFLEKVVNIDKKTVSEYESFLLQTYLVDKPQLFSFFFILYAIDYGEYSELLNGDSNVTPEMYLKLLQKNIDEVNGVISGKSILSNPNDNNPMNSYLRYVKLTSFLYHSTILSETILKDYNTNTPVIKDYLKALNDSYKFIKKNENEIKELRGIFSEKQYMFDVSSSIVF